MTWLEALLDAPFVCITDMLRRFAQERGEHAALICDGEVVTYAALDARVDRFAAALQRDGIKPRDAIALCAAASAEYAVAFLGGLRAGAAVAPLAPSSSAASLVGMIGNSGARLLFLDADVRRLLEPVATEISAIPIALDAHAGSAALEAWLAPKGAMPDAVTIDPAWPFNIIYSSGTTGTPKGIVQSHGMRWAYAVRSIQRGYGPDATTLISTPLYSNTTLVSFMPTLTFGGTVVLMPKFDATRYLELAQQYRVTHTMLVPVQYQRLMAHPDFDRYDLSGFQAKFCTSAPFAASVKADVVRRWPGKLTEYYGMTEGGGSCQLEADEFPAKLHTVGKPMEGHDIRLIDELGNEVAAGGVGEIVGHSPAMMTGYYRQPDKTAEAEWYDPSGKRFIRTGDMGRFDADGFLTLLDRKKDMIISGGFNIYPSDLESELCLHPDVADVAVVGAQSAQWGETPVAFVVRRPLASIDTDTLLAWVNARLGKMQRLSALTFIDALPRSPIGKVLKRELREQYSRAAR
ncbi:4-coumarate--CoA ligase [Paraburkholderia caffeinilytica]|uniref:4-coumarate--CoA ligase n=1 Tax=Paraburkholderia caffeinilytica TaxID=1761016 RepID=A0ABQ1NFD6_9BURK|nr:class I adenylate-forming enzyme family protein [Paraburkholderia caffeinilytica]AXL49649.1 4-coumarate--CoA ligase [Paraburkholderia caffeinilytica]GGC69191.1 4-coumarate--CoA ligase [Paraburkholderia caffeinilytica]CAB3806511.1 Long-chain-fatty-acid--CoA ligase [Paraburkholderia caffeinilytica]